MALSKEELVEFIFAMVEKAQGKKQLKAMDIQKAVLKAHPDQPKNDIKFGIKDLIDGDRGLYDGLDAQGTYSAGELAKFLATPVVLVVDCTMRTRTTAAMVLGCQHFDPEVPIRGVVLNQIARPRHEAIIRQAIETYCGIPVLGAIPRLKCDVFPERHMGLVPPQEHATAIRAVTTARDLALRYLDLEGLWQVASQAPPLPEVIPPPAIFCADCTPPVI